MLFLRFSPSNSLIMYISTVRNISIILIQKRYLSEIYSNLHNSVSNSFQEKKLNLVFKENL